MRITGGTAAGRILKVPKGLDVRPTPDLVKQAIFNSLGERVLGARALELFAGTGALSLECLSRGAEDVVCVERSRRHAEVLRQNCELAGLPRKQIHIRVQDAFQALVQFTSGERRFTLVLADPPYGAKTKDERSESLAQQLLDDPFLPALLAPEGLFILGHARRDAVAIPPPWIEMKALKHGDTWMRFLRVDNAQIASKPDSGTPWV
jgi:16S rRNA (guanine966-N2)-methyltransferase